MNRLLQRAGLVALLILLASGAHAGRSCAAKAAAKPLQPGDLVAVCGDSITEQKLYSIFMEDYFLMCQPAPRLSQTQAGWGGEQAPGFLGRMQMDVLTLKPTVATTCYGMNDGWYRAMTPETDKRYRDAMREIVRTFKQAGVRTIVAGSPGCVDSTYFRPGTQDSAVYNQTLAALRDIARDVAKEEGVLFADVHTPMMDVMAKAKAKYGTSYPVAGLDGVHPAPNGHLVMAYAFLKALGCDGNIGTITVSLRRAKAAASEGHKVLSARRGAVELESTRYPFCFTGAPADPQGTRGTLAFIPFNQELNRFMLVVKGARAGARYRVTWGQASGEFSGAALAKGINLAAEFPENPFCEPFQKVEQKVRAQQEFETALTHNLLHGMPDLRTIAPAESAALDRITAEVCRRDQSLAAEAAAAVAPVRHTLSVERIK